MKRFLFFLFSSLSALTVSAQVTLTQAYQAAIDHHPLSNQQALIREVSALQDENIAVKWMPQFNLEGQAVYLSTVLAFPLSFPGVEIPQIPQFQYGAALNVQQLIYDGGAVKAAHAVQAADQQVQQQQVKVDLNKVKDIVSQTFFGVLMLEKQAQVLAATDSLLQVRREVIAAGVNKGAVLPSALDQIEKQIIQLHQQQSQTATDLAALRVIWASWTGLPADAALIAPVEAAPITTGWEQRPEETLLNLQMSKLQAAQSALQARKNPTLAAFGKGGAGRPNPLNYFETGLSPYYQLGVKLSWSPWQWGTLERESQSIALQSQMLDNQRAALEQQWSAAQTKDQSQVIALDNLLAADTRILELQQRIVTQSEAQMDHGVITTSEYLTEVQALTQARLNREIHLLQRSQAVANLLTRAGKW